MIKILVVNGQSMYDKNATGITLQSMFSKFDNESIMEVYYSQIQTDLEPACAYKSYSLPIETVPLNYLIRQGLGRKRINNYNQSITGIDLRSNQARKNKKAMLKSFILGLINYSPVFVRDANVLKEIDGFKPDIVYTLGADIIPLKLAEFFSRRYDNIPILIHYMDNWPETKYANSIALSVFHKKLQRIISDIRCKNNYALVISDKMASEYNEKYYPVKHFPIMNAIAIHGKQLTKNVKKNQQDVIFAYLGGLHLGRDEQLVKIQNAIDLFNCSCKGTNAKLYIYTSKTNRDKFEKKFDKSCVEFKDFVPHEQVFIEYEKADVLLHIESFDSDLIDFTKYSLSTKISEYMFSGKPILLYGPEELAVYQYIQSNECGICVHEEERLIEAITELVTNEEYRYKLGNNGHNTAIEKHSDEAAYHTIISVSKLLIGDRRKK